MVWCACASVSVSVNVVCEHRRDSLAVVRGYERADVHKDRACWLLCVLVCKSMCMSGAHVCMSVDQNAFVAAWVKD
jgi:hypothetical protein